jgi:hypothetical protein
MSGYAILPDPTRVYTKAEVLQGKGVGQGQVVTDNSGKVYRFCKVPAGQNLFRGQLVQIVAQANLTGDYVVVGPTAPAGVPTSGALGVYVATATASTSAFVFVQVYGNAVVIASASGNYTPGLPLKPGATPGNVEQGATTASAYISGMTVQSTVTVSAVVSLINVFLNYPRIISG